MTQNRRKQSKTAFIFGIFYAVMRPVTGFSIILIYSK